MKKNTLCLVIFLAFSCSVFAAAPAYLTAKQFADAVRKNGAEKVIASIPDSDGGDWDYIMTHIASGDSDWLKVVPMVVRTGAEGWNQDITSALAHAIPINVEGVMSVIDEHNVPTSTNQICAMPLYRDTVPQQNEYFVKAVQALYKSKNIQAKKCLKRLVDTVGQSGPFKEID